MRADAVAKVIRADQDKSSLSSTAALDLGYRIGRRLLRQASPTTLGIRFPEISDAGQEEYWDNLYRGASGVGIALLDLLHATGDAAYESPIREIAYDLIESIPSHFHLHPGLYVGNAGTALFLLRAACTFRDTHLLSESCRLSDRLAERTFHGTDIISGAAGTGLFFLTMFNATRNDRYLEAARRAVAFLAEKAEPVEHGLTWAPLIPDWGESTERYSPQTGLSHGVAGICLFLLEMAAATGEDLPGRLYEAGISWLDSRIVTVESRNYWPVSLEDPKLRYHWCHGSAGISHAYLALHRHVESKAALQTAAAAGRAALHHLRGQPHEPLYHCHGLAGILESFLELAQMGAEANWRATAVEFLPRFRDEIEKETGRSSLGRVGCSLALGAAGIARLLLRMGGKPVLPILNPACEALNISPSGAPREIILNPASNTSRHHPAGTGPDSWNTWAGAERDLLPYRVVKLTDRSTYVRFDPDDETADGDFFSAYRRHTGSTRFFACIEKIHRLSQKLELEYNQILSPGVLNGSFHGPFLREIAGLSLLPEDNHEHPSAVIDKLSSQYTNMLKLLLSRLSKDIKHRLSSETSGRITAMEILTSDPHRKGQRVIAMRFEGGEEWIYKSRSVSLERFLVGASRSGETLSLAEKLNEWLDPCLPGYGLATHRIIPGGEHYGYVERIRSRMASIERISSRKIEGLGRDIPPLQVRAAVLKKAEEKGFWYASGLLAGYAMGMGLCDLHSENLFCGLSASTPHIALHPIDIELGFHEFDCLRDTLLVDMIHVEDPEAHARGAHAHPGFDREIKLCGTSSEAWVFRLTPEGYVLTPGTHLAAELDLPYLVQNHDGTIGYGSHLLWFLRGLIDTWLALKTHRKETADFLVEHLTGIPIRVMAKATRLYVHGQRKFRNRAYPSSGASWSSEAPLPYPIFDSEMRQLSSGDIPYFFRYLGEGHGSPSGIRWFDGLPEGGGDEADLKRIYHGLQPFWSIVERQTGKDVLARALSDAIAFAAPEGPFDMTDNDLGIRVFRPEGEEKIWFVILLEKQRMTCRIDGEGGVSIWED